jgi:Domain of unknown function (DUF4328)/Protein of unknown function (DUF2510)
MPNAGWYPNPEGPAGSQRYWDGTRWTDEFKASGSKLHHVVGEPEPVKPLWRLRNLAIGGIVVIALIEAFSLIGTINRIALDQSFLDGGLVSREDLAHADDLDEAAAIGLVVGYLVLGPLTFIPWFHRAYSNLPRLGHRLLRYSPGWAIGSWFIPIFNLFRPKQIANDVYRGSQPNSTGREFFSDPVDPLLHWWWGILLASGLVARAAATVINDANDDVIFTAQAAVDAVEQEKTGLVISGVASVMAIVAAVLAIRVIARLTDAQVSTASATTQAIAPNYGDAPR